MTSWLVSLPLQIVVISVLSVSLKTPPEFRKHVFLWSLSLPLLSLLQLSQFAWSVSDHLVSLEAFHCDWGLCGPSYTWAWNSCCSECMACRRCDKNLDLKCSWRNKGDSPKWTEVWTLHTCRGLYMLEIQEKEDELIGQQKDQWKGMQEDQINDLS